MVARVSFNAQPQAPARSDTLARLVPPKLSRTSAGAFGLALIETQGRGAAMALGETAYLPADVGTNAPILAIHVDSDTMSGHERSIYPDDRPRHD